MSVSTPVNRASILTSFLTQVQNPLMSTMSAWHVTVVPNSMTEVHRLLGPQAQSTPAYPTNIGEITTTNVFYLLHGFAVALTRHRRARGWVLRDANQSPIDLGYALTSYAANNVIWFNYPTIPPVGDPITATVLNNFLVALRNQVANIKTNNAYASDMVACHSSSPPPSCHGSRGRR